MKSHGYYSLLVIALCVADILLLPMAGQCFFASMRLVFTFFLHHLEPSTEIGSGFLTDLVCTVVWGVYLCNAYIPLRTWVPLSDFTVALILTCLHAGVALVAAIYKLASCREKAPAKELPTTQVQKAQMEERRSR